MKRILLFFLILIPFLTGCNDEDETPEVDAFIFGQWEFFCEGNCMQFYKLDQGRLFIDNLNTFRDAPIITYKAAPLDSRFLSQAEQLRAAFPENYLRPLGNDFVACPNCIEEGAYYLAFENRTGVLWWQVGKNPALWPAEIRPFMELLVQTLDELPKE
ncbi:hypothetical protein [Algoriphagus confluentis]|uniref:Uncharacterized protein n=1 Tax=Algoriphagus confluentis TaxID=1697556 RepID=A0ABQ6PLG0_9BACT|nr:hypothetical protein Aconfl_07630 [Algoriphagus confluentis]